MASFVAILEAPGQAAAWREQHEHATAAALLAGGALFEVSGMMLLALKAEDDNVVAMLGHGLHVGIFEFITVNFFFLTLRILDHDRLWRNYNGRRNLRLVELVGLHLESRSWLGNHHRHGGHLLLHPWVHTHLWLHAHLWLHHAIATAVGVGVSHHLVLHLHGHRCLHHGSHTSTSACCGGGRACCVGA